MAYRFRRMPLSAKVSAFQTEVSCDQYFVSRLDAKNGTIIAYSLQDPGAKSDRGQGGLTNATAPTRIRVGPSS